MRHRDAEIGSFVLADKADGEAFTGEDEKVLTLSAAQAAIANARVHRADLEALIETLPVGVAPCRSGACRGRLKRHQSGRTSPRARPSHIERVSLSRPPRSHLAPPTARHRPDCRSSIQLLYPEPTLHSRAIRLEETNMPQVNFRTSSERLAVIDRAAATRDVSRTEFVLRSSEAAAIETLNERPVIALDDEAWDDFVAALDAPVEIEPAVKARYARAAQWVR